MTDELLRGISPEWKPGQPITDDIIKKARLTEWATPTARANHEKEMRIFAERNNMWLAEFGDPALVGLAREIADKGWDEATIKQHVREQTYKAVMLHEVGHTLGLRHNFGGSADPLNYMDEYWAVRPNTFGILQKQQLTADDLMLVNCTMITAENQAACEEQTNARMSEYQQSSIMDYGSRFNSDYQGLGKYDWAAIAAGYGDLVEVFDETVSQQLNTVALDNQGGTAAAYLDAFAAFTSPLDGNFADVVHYVNFPSVFGGVENISKRKYIPRSSYEAEGNTLVRVPYYACYDEYRDSTSRCHTWDQGADHYEITQNFIQSYKEYYLFNNYQRDRIGFSSFGVFNRVLGRYFFPIQNMYQNWIFGRSQLDSIGGFYSQMGMLEGFETIYKAMSGHLYGTYQKNNQGVWEWAGYQDQSSQPNSMYVPRGDGRRLFTTFDRDSGYNWINRPLEAGVFFEQLAAIMALTSAQSGALAVGQDAAADVLSFSLPYNLVFSEEINNVFSGTFTENYDVFAPRVVDGKLVTPSPIFAGEGDDDWDKGERVNYQTAWSSRIYAALYGMAMLNVNYDVTFARRNQVAIGGSGDEVNPGAGFETVRFNDPVSGRQFTAWRPQVPQPGTIYPAADMVARLQPLGDQHRGLQEKLALLTESTDPDSEYAKTQTQLRNVEFEIQDVTRDLEILRGMYYYFGRAW